MPKASRGARCRQRDTIHVEHVDLVTLQQIIKCVRANLLDQAPLRIMDGDALEPVYRERWQLQSRSRIDGPGGEGTVWLTIKWAQLAYSLGRDTKDAWIQTVKV